MLNFSIKNCCKIFLIDETFRFITCYVKILLLESKKTCKSVGWDETEE